MSGLLPQAAQKQTFADFASVPIATFVHRSKTFIRSLRRRAPTLSGNWRPSALAVVRLMTSRYLDACSTGSSAGLAPLSLVDVDSGAPSQIVDVRAVAHETAGLHIPLAPEHPRQPVLQRKLGQACGLRVAERRRHGNKAADE